MVFKNCANIKNRPSYEGLFFYVEIKFSLVQQRQRLSPVKSSILQGDPDIG